MQLLESTVPQQGQFLPANSIDSIFLILFPRNVAAIISIGRDAAEGFHEPYLSGASLLDCLFLEKI